MHELRRHVTARPYTFPLVLALLLLVANTIAAPEFGNPSNWSNELTTLAPFVLIALASTPAILSGGGGIDISVGPLMILVNVVLTVWLLPRAGLRSAWLDLPIVLAIGAAIGAANGFLVAVLRYRPVIATLCTFFILSGLVLKIAPNPESVGHNWTTALGTTVDHVPGALILLAVPIAIWLLLSRTSFHRTLYSVGGDDATAYSAGVSVVHTRLLAYTLGGLFAAVAGIALTALVQATQADAVTDYTLAPLAAVALGGTSFGGGYGGLLGSFLGGLSIYLLQTLLLAFQVSPNWLQPAYGGLLIIGVIVGAGLLLVDSHEIA